MRVNRSLVEDCCGWNKKLWTDATIFGLSQLSDDLRNKHVLEIGAGAYSSLSPIFVDAGASVTCSYYGQPRAAVEQGQLALISDKHKLDRVTLREIDIFDIDGIYDIIILKSVLGGIGRGNDYRKIMQIIKNMLENNVKEDGCIISIDNGHISWLAKIRRWLGAGKNNWTYLDRRLFTYLSAGLDVRTNGFGFLNAGALRFVLDAEKAEVINHMLYILDLAIIKMFNPQERAVLATYIQRTPSVRKLIMDL